MPENRQQLSARGINRAAWRCQTRIFGKKPVKISRIRQGAFETAKIRICRILSDLYNEREFLKDSGVLTKKDLDYFDRVSETMTETEAALSLHKLCDFMQRYYKKKVIILLDEYDTPMQEAYVNGYRDEILSFMRNLFHSTFKTNPFLYKGTRIDEQIVFDQLDINESGIWSLLLASGYLKVEEYMLGKSTAAGRY